MSTPAVLASAEPVVTCFHCGLPVPPASDFRVDIGGAARPMCCRGCEAVARAIVDGGMGDYYKFRTAAAPTAREIVPEFLRQTALYDHPEIQKSFVRADGEHVREAALILEGITCPACVWLNERHLAHVPGVLQVHINYATHRARVRWDERRAHLSDILEAVSRIGYLAHPFDPGRHQLRLENERKHLLRRLGVAGVMTMQVMILSEALYVGDWVESEIQYRDFFHWISLLLTLPVLLYSAQPFFTAAWRDLRHRRVGMDVPVALGMGTAFLASLWTTVTGTGTIYFDSVCMFAFFLLSARYFELAAHKRATEASEALVQATPAMATRIKEYPLSPAASGEREKYSEIEETVAVAELQPGDRVRIRPGEPIPADGVVLEGRSTVDESLLTGEHLPVPKAPGQALIGGSINIESPLTARVGKTGPDTILSSILRLLDRASAEKPRLAQLADRIAAGFVTMVLLLAGLTALYWWNHDAALWLPATIAVLVVTCPCALSLATPAAITAATGRLTRLGLLVTRGHALETFAHATHFIFDKTGTLTRGRLRLLETRTFSRLSAAHCLGIAGALERHSEHPIARALGEAAGSGAVNNNRLQADGFSPFRLEADQLPLSPGGRGQGVRGKRRTEESGLSPRPLPLTPSRGGEGEHNFSSIESEGFQPSPRETLTAGEVVNTPGAGLCGNVAGGKFFLGTPAYMEEQTGHAVDPAVLEPLRRQGDTVVLLAGQNELHAAFVLSDELRPGARELIEELQRQGKTVMLLTGDHEKAARRVADALGIRELAWELKPADKHEHIKALQQQGAVVAMIGDGVNDAPVLAAAQVSVAMGGGTAVAAASADMILLSQNLMHLADGLAVAHRTLDIIRQNLVWAVAYNLFAIPAAVAGYVSPWMAALGMSLSSLLVVGNALRLTRTATARSPAAASPG